MAAVLRCRPLAALSRLTAASWLGLGPTKPDVIDVSVPHHRHPVKRLDQRVHRTRIFDGSDILIVRSIPVTRPERTLVDLAGIERRAFESIVDTALARHLLSLGSIERYIAARGFGGYPEIRELAAIIEDRGRGVPESELERLFLRLVRRERLPEPARQCRIGRRRIDFGYPEYKIAIELDGRQPHGSRARFQDDRRRQNAIVLEGWLVLRFTWDDVTHRSGTVAASIRKALTDRAS